MGNLKHVKARLLLFTYNLSRWKANDMRPVRHEDAEYIHMLEHN